MEVGDQVQDVIQVDDQPEAQVNGLLEAGPQPEDVEDGIIGPLEELHPVDLPNHQLLPVPNDIENEDPFFGWEEREPRRRSARTPKPTEKLRQWKGLEAVVREEGSWKEISTLHKVPKTYQEAINCEESEQWKKAILDEFNSLVENGTWEVVPLPEGRTTVDNMWVFDIKPGQKGDRPRFKGRLVAKGYTQEYGVDYEETFAPVLKQSALRIILGLVAALDLEVKLLDVKTAFLYGELQEEIYMSQPEGFVIPGREKEVCRLIKCIYGLKQAPRVWNARFNEFLAAFGLVRSTADPCVYYSHQEEGLIILAVFVDDALICGSKKELVGAIITYLETHFQIRVTGADRFLGVELNRIRENRELTAAQPDFIQAILRKFNMEGCKPKSTPADPHTQLSKEMSPTTDEEAEEMKKVPYREAVGSLLYLATTTRPDIAYAVGQVSQFCQNPGKAHWSGVKRILAYLSGTQKHGLRFGAGQEPLITGFSDADFARDMDQRRSITGYIFFAHEGPVIWTSRKQNCTSLSTTEAEYIASCEAAKEAIWVTRLLTELRLKEVLPVPLYSDNQSAIRLAKNPEFHQRTKHIDIKYHFIREQVEKGVISLEFVGTENQLADLFTKPLEMVRFQDLRQRIGVVEMKSEISE